MKYSRMRDASGYRNQGFPKNPTRNYGGNKQSSSSDNSTQAFFNGKTFDVNLASKSLCRALNLEHLKKYVFNDSGPLLAEKAEIAPQRLASIINLDLPVGDELAEHIEFSLGLNAGWLDQRRDQWAEEDTSSVKDQIFSMQAIEEESAPQASTVATTPHPAAHEDTVHLLADPLTGIPSEDQAVASDVSSSEQIAIEHVGHERQVVASTPTVAAIASMDSEMKVVETASSNAAPVDAMHPTTAISANLFEQDLTKSKADLALPESNMKERQTKMFPHQEALIWLHEQLKSKPRGTTSQIARHMKRNPNDVSSWLNILRGIPGFCVSPLMRALDEITPDLAQEARFRFEAHDVEIQPPQSAVAPLHQPAQYTIQSPAATSSTSDASMGQDVAVEQELRITSPAAPSPAPANSFGMRNVAGLSYMSYPKQPGVMPVQSQDAAKVESPIPAVGQTSDAIQGPQPEQFRLVVAQTLNTMAEVMKALMEPGSKVS